MPSSARKKKNEDSHAKIYKMIVSPHEGCALAGNINFWPSFFYNGVFASASKHVISFFFNDTATTEIYTLSLHDALPICNPPFPRPAPHASISNLFEREWFRDRKSTRLNSSHVKISYAVFCLKKKKK